MGYCLVIVLSLPRQTIWERLHDWSTGRADDVVDLLAVGILLFLLPELGLLRTELPALSIGLGVLDLGGLVFVSVAILIAIAAGGSRAIGAVGQWAADNGYLSAPDTVP